MSVTKFEGAGGTRFLTSAPRPLVVLGTDINTDAGLRLALKVDADADLAEHDITLQTVQMPSLVFSDGRDEVKGEAKDKWDEARDFLRPYVVGDDDTRAKTLGLDTADDVYDLLVEGIFGKLEQIDPESRKNFMGRANTAYKGVIHSAYARGLNVVLVHKAKEQWGDKTTLTNRGEIESRVRLTGPFDMERGGFKGTGFLTSLDVHLAFDYKRDGPLSSKYGVKIMRCTHRPGLIGRRWWGKQQVEGQSIHCCTFPFLMTQVFPRTTISDWS